MIAKESNNISVTDKTCILLCTKPLLEALPSTPLNSFQGDKSYAVPHTTNNYHGSLESCAISIVHQQERFIRRNRNHAPNTCTQSIFEYGLTTESRGCYRMRGQRQMLTRVESDNLLGCVLCVLGRKMVW